MTRRQTITIAVAGVAVVGGGVVGLTYLAGALLADRDGATRMGRLANRLLGDDSPLGRAMAAITNQADARNERKAADASRDTD